jgi:hypothetical protein
MNAVGGADVDTKEILDAGVGDHIGHDGFPEREIGVLRPLTILRLCERRKGCRDGGSEKDGKKSLELVTHVTATAVGKL